jgi:hypothetical protein
MLSKLHEALRLLFRDRPTLAPEVLRNALQVPVPDFTEARIESGDLTEAVPRELRADHVVGLYNGAARVLSIIVEPQLKLPDEKKIRAWIGYVSGSFIRYRCQACLLVVTTHRAVATRSAQPIVLGPGSVITPLVLGPGSVPIITAPEVAQAMPEVAVLSAMAHGRSKAGLKVALAALAGLAGLEEEEHAMLYGDVMLSCLHETARRALEAMMASGEYEIQSKFLKKYVAKGKKEGAIKTKAAAVLTVLEARGLSIPDEVRERVAASADLPELEHWLRRAVVVDSAREIFTDTR